MTIYIAHQAFSGPYDSADPVADRAGIFAILSGPGHQQKIHCLAQSANVRTALILRLKEHDFAARTDLAIAVHYTPGVQASARKHMTEKLLREITI